MQSIYTHFTENQIICKTNVPLSAYSTIGIGGNAAILAFPQTKEQAKFVVDLCLEEKVPLYILGRGSNLLVSDNGVNGVVLSTAKLDNLRYVGSTVTAQAGVSLYRLLQISAQKGFGGMENLYGIPASVGGGIRMNCGAFGAEIANRLRYVDALDLTNGHFRRYLKKECSFAYRQNIFQKRPHLIIEGNFSLTQSEPKYVYEKMHFILTKRKEKQPYTQKSAGSVFRRPPKGYAAKMIEDVGLKGFSVGGAAVSDLHAGFIVNQNNASAKDVLALIEIIKAKVINKYGIHLCCEIEMWGGSDVVHK